MPPAITLVRWVNENAFASMVQARPIPPLADRFIAGATPIDYGPGLLLMPFGFHLAVDTLPSGDCKAWLQVHLGCIRLSPSCPFSSPWQKPLYRGTTRQPGIALISGNSCEPNRRSQLDTAR